MPMAPALAEPGTHAQEFSSGVEQTGLLELYTSEGCSSCPPAEAWLAKLEDSPRLWREIVPVAFHVDYWDYLGWRDPWARKEFSQRQRAYAADWRSRSVYTPGFAWNGREWRGWFERRTLPGKSGETAGILKAASKDGGQWRIRFEPSWKTASDLDVYAALLAGELVSEVRAGENRGRRLEHDFVVLELVKQRLGRDGEAYQQQIALGDRSTPKGRLALAVWVSPAGKQAPIQAVGGWLSRSLRQPLRP